MTVRFATYDQRPDLLERWLPEEMEFIHPVPVVSEL